MLMAITASSINCLNIGRTSCSWQVEGLLVLLEPRKSARKCTGARISTPNLIRIALAETKTLSTISLLGQALPWHWKPNIRTAGKIMVFTSKLNISKSSKRVIIWAHLKKSYPKSYLVQPPRRRPLLQNQAAITNLCRCSSQLIYTAMILSNTCSTTGAHLMKSAQRTHSNLATTFQSNSRYSHS